MYTDTHKLIISITIRGSLEYKNYNYLIEFKLIYNVQ